MHMGLALALGGSLYACRGGGTNTDTAGAGASTRAASTCTPGRQDCPCAPDGAVASCGRTVSRRGDYVNCSMGTSVCRGGLWGVCVGSTLVTKSVHGATLGASGLRILSTTTQCPSGSPQCADPCDPYAYTLWASGPDDVDAANVVPEEGGEGGVTIAGKCQEVGCQLATDCSSGSPTAIEGKVYDPAGIHPVYNANVYVPFDADAPLPPIVSGASCDACSSAPSIQAAAVAQTDAFGHFRLTNVPTTDVAPGNAIPLVIEVGKWRREVLLSSVPKCATTTVDAKTARLPRNQFDGAGGHADIPKIAIAAAGDPFECLLLRMGIDPAEFQSPGAGTRRIDYYPSGTLASLVGSTASLMNYDVVILPCQSASEEGNNQYADNVSAYANAGGRVYTSHFGYAWLTTPTGTTPNKINPATGQPNPFYGVANWNLNSSAPYVVTTAAIATSFPKGAALATWAQNVGATDAGNLPIPQARADIASVNAPTTSWILEPPPDPPPPPPTLPAFFSFDTPVGGTGADAGATMCGRVDYADFHVPDTTLVSRTGDGQCDSDADCGFTANCIPATLGTCTPKPCASNAECGAGYTCNGAMPGMCTPQNCTHDFECASGSCVGGTCACTTESECVSGSCTGGKCLSSSKTCTFDSKCGSVERCTGATPGACQNNTCTNNSQCTQGELCSSGSCQGCYDGSTCPTNQCRGAVPSHCSASSNSFPLMCKQGGFSPEEDALEFLLLDLTTCVSSDSLAPPAPTTSGSAHLEYMEATFQEDFTASCPQGTRAVWRELDWQATIPNTAQIVFSALTASAPVDGGVPDYSGSTMPIQLATVTSSTTPPGDVAYIDTGTTGAFNTAMPPVISRDSLRLFVDLKPTSDFSAAPTLLDWQVKADCLPSE
jgi:hypothetical protein